MPGTPDLFVRGIARLDPATFEIRLIAESPVSIGAGGDYLDGRIYFGNGSHIYSYRVAVKPASAINVHLRVQCQGAYILIPRSQKGKDGLRNGER